MPFVGPPQLSSLPSGWGTPAQYQGNALLVVVKIRLSTGWVVGLNGEHDYRGIHPFK